MNFQTVIKLPYVINLIYAILNNNSFSHPDNNIDIISIDNLYYIKDYKKNLYIINEDMGNKKYSKLQQILRTCIHFEEYKEFPINSFSLIQRKSIDRGHIDIELLKILQIQYATNKSYFNYHFVETLPSDLAKPIHKIMDRHRGKKTRMVKPASPDPNHPYYTSDS